MHRCMAVSAVSVIYLLMSASLASADPGPAPLRGAIAEYDPSTGVIKVSANETWNWWLRSLGNLTGDPAAGLTHQLQTDNDNIIGEGSFVGPFSYLNLNLGAVAVTGLSQSDFEFKYRPCSHFATCNEVEVPVLIAIIPEPTSLALVGLALCGFLTRRTR